MKVGRLLHEFGEKVALFGQIRTNCTNFTPDLSEKHSFFVVVESSVSFSQVLDTVDVPSPHRSTIQEHLE